MTEDLQKRMEETRIAWAIVRAGSRAEKAGRPTVRSKRLYTKAMERFEVLHEYDFAIRCAKKAGLIEGLSGKLEELSIKLKEQDDLYFEEEFKWMKEQKIRYQSYLAKDHVIKLWE